MGLGVGELGVGEARGGGRVVCTLCEPLWCAPPPPISEATSAAVLAPMLASAVCFWKFLTGTPL